MVGQDLSSPTTHCWGKERMGLAGQEGFGEGGGGDSCLELFSIVESDHHSRHHPSSEECLQDVPGYSISYQVEVQRIFPLGWKELAWHGCTGTIEYSLLQEEALSPTRSSWGWSDHPHNSLHKKGLSFLSTDEQINSEQWCRLLRCGWVPDPHPGGLSVPVEQQGLHEGDDLSAGIVSRTHDGHVQQLRRNT